MEWTCLEAENKYTEGKYIKATITLYNSGNAIETQVHIIFISSMIQVTNMINLIIKFIPKTPKQFYENYCKFLECMLTMITNKEMVIQKNM